MATFPERIADNVERLASELAQRASIERGYRSRNSRARRRGPPRQFRKSAAVVPQGRFRQATIGFGPARPKALAAHGASNPEDRDWPGSDRCLAARRELPDTQKWRLLMSRLSTVPLLKSKSIPAISTIAVLTVLGSVAIAAPMCSMSMVRTCGPENRQPGDPPGRQVHQDDRYTLKAPNGVEFSDIRGYETWPAVAVSQVEDGLKVIVANPTMIDAYRAGVPSNGKPFPDGSKIVKIEWSQKEDPESP